MFASLSNAHLYTAIRLNATFAEPGASTSIAKSGTAFFVRSPTAKVCIVTNRHMLELDYGPDGTKYRNYKLQSLSVEAFVAPGGDVNAIPTERFIADIALPSSSPRFPKDYFEDVAVILQPAIHVRGGRSHEIAFFINHAELADDAWIAANLWVCDFVAFPGFPPWHDKLAQRPILRTGTISSDPRVNYSDEPISKGRRVAYEAFSFGGSSGSPVFAPPPGHSRWRGHKGRGLS